MLDAEDDFTLIPSPVDLSRLEDLEVDGRVQAENETWVVCRYPPKPGQWKWCEYSLVVNCEGLPSKRGTYELKTLKALIAFLEQLEKQRLARRKKDDAF